MRLTLEHPGFAHNRGLGVRVAIIDSGLAWRHPHIAGGPCEDGVWITPAGEDPETTDRVGHGTAVAAAIREKAPEAILVPVRIFDRELATTASTIVRAIEWAVRARIALVNLSVGTANAVHASAFEQALTAAARAGVLVVAATEVDGAPHYPGALAVAIGVRADASLPRDAIEVDEGDARLGLRLRASPLPRPVPGVPVERNLSGVSFAVANASGVLARVLATCGPGESLEARLLSLCARG